VNNRVRGVDDPDGAVFVSPMFTIIGGDGREYGPVSAEQVRVWINSGRANLETQAKALGTAEWRRLGDFAEFASPDDLPPVMSPPAADGTPAVVVGSAELATLGQRFGAAAIDGVLKTLCWLPTSLAVWRVLGDQIRSGQQPSPAELLGAMEGVVSNSLPFLAVLAVVQGVLIARRSQSIGKALLGIRIVRFSDLQPAGFLRGFGLRGAVPWFIEQIPLLGGLFWMVDVGFIFGAERRCLHDLIAGTKVVKI
jgi:uncharacterized RDD family membrane protein YckC